MMKRDHCLNAEVSVRHKVVEILAISLEVEIPKISLPTSLAVADVDHVKVRIYKLKRQLPFANLFLEQPLNCV